VCDLETSRIGAPYIYDISNLRVKSAVTKIYLPRYFILKIKALISNVHNNISNKSPTRCPRTWLEEAGNTYSFWIGKTFWNLEFI
jgi:hypothetical protein